jgi:hypothetical protein
MFLTYFSYLNLSNSLFVEFEQKRPKKKDCMGRCVLCLLIQAVFIFGVFLAFLVGHWASEVEFGNDVSRVSLFYLKFNFY